MKIEFDEAKNQINLAKHGIPLSLAAEMDFDTAIVVPDARYNYGEERANAFGLIHGRLHGLAFTMRGKVLRAISLRKANIKERKMYDKET